MEQVEKITPMMRQYHEIKSSHSDCILLYRLGDFYEMFYEDAIKASKILGITLTSRNKGLASEVPMCGVPYHAVQNYIGKLTNLGIKVAICDQVSDPNLHGIVERSVTRIVTPGTLVSDNNLDALSNNYLVALYFSANNLINLGRCDITTGEISHTDVTYDQLFDELSRISPKEILLDTTLHKDILLIIAQRGYITTHFSTEHISEQKNAKSMLLAYIASTQKLKPSHILSHENYSIEEFLILDENTIRNLELVSTMRDGSRIGSLLYTIDRTCTAMGARLLKNFLLRPLLKEEKILQRQSGVTELIHSQLLQEEFRIQMKNLPDVERTVGRLTLKAGNPKDVIGLKQALQKIHEIKKILSQCSSEILHGSRESIFDHSQLYALISQAINEEASNDLSQGNIIKSGYSVELDELRNLQSNAKTILIELGEREAKRTGISSLKVRYTSVFGYFLEITNANKHLVPADYICKQTLTNAERYITAELKEIEEKILSAEQKILSLEKKLFEEVIGAICEKSTEILQSAGAVALLDVLLSFAIYASENTHTLPTINTEGKCEILDGRHPVIEALIAPKKFIPNDTSLNRNDEFLMIITGPNMAGKSTYLRQIALITMMAHMGMYVPAKSASIPLTDRIFTRVGASDNLTKGESTFMVEMQEAATILKNATKQSLIILDEIGRGTSTYDGLAIAQSIVHYIHDSIGALTFFATHYHELIHTADELTHTCNWSVQVAEKECFEYDGTLQKKVIFLYKVLPGGVDRSYGIEVAALAGLPEVVIKNAKLLLHELEIKEMQKSPQLSQEIKFSIPENYEREHKIIKEINPQNITPLEALQKLYELKNISKE